MATVLLSAAGAAIGSSVGGSVLGLSMTALGRFAGATMGRAIDQSVLGQGADVVEHGKIERFRLTNAGEGDPVAQVYGRVRVAGQVIWATQFSETVAVTGGGKGLPSGPKTRDYSYSVSLAIALCEGVISGVGRVWADGAEVDPESLGMRVYRGTEDQMPDPKMEAVEGVGAVPAYRGTAYVVIEELGLERFGNRVPQLEFEVMRPEQGEDAGDMAHQVQAVAMMPGSGEYALATTPVHYNYGVGQSALANVNTPAGKADFRVATERMITELPNLKASSLVVSWFGSDLRCGSCAVRPKVEQAEHDGSEMPWRSGGITRSDAELVPEDASGRPVYGGTPSDGSVIEAIRHLNDEGVEVLYYPFMLMDQMTGNGLADPYGGEEQPALPWRGRITLSVAPGLDGSSDETAAADAEIAAFFGTASVADFAVTDGAVSYTGPDEWSYRRFILHNAALCAAAGGVEAFSIGSEMRELTKLRGAAGFKAVEALRAVAAEARALLGPECKIGYCADWSEYFGFNAANGDRYFHLDALWADDNIDFIGIDNYMPLSDWRDEDGEADADWGSLYNPAYLEANILGGEGYDWFYHSEEAREAQIRTPITDDAHSEPWVWRFKDILSWWSSDHHERIDGVRSYVPTAWVPQSKPIWFTELGCAAIDKGTNQPNKFLDPKSSESSLPHYSNGRRDEYLQAQYLRAMHDFWGREENNPQSVEYDGRMLDMSRAFVWAWDARPYPHFPAAHSVWSDGENYARGHWISGRASARSLASVVSEICERSGCAAYDVSALEGMVDGYAVAQVSDARAALQPLMLAYGFDAVERDGVLTFQMRDGETVSTLEPDQVALSDELEGDVERQRASDAELVGRVRLRFVESGGDFDVIAEEAILPDEGTHAVAASELPLVMRRGAGRQVLERWLSEARVQRDTLRFALPPSRLDVAAGDVVEFEGQPWRVDRVDLGAARMVEAVRIEPESYNPVDLPDEHPQLPSFVPPVPVFPLFLDLPLLTGAEVPHAPHLAVTAKPWPGSAAVYSSLDGEGYDFETLVTHRATVGVLETPLARACAGVYDRHNALAVQLTSGELASVTQNVMLGGRNLAAVGDGSSGNWELVQFRDAELVGEGRYVLRHLLRGQRGSDAWQPDVWPEGSYFVLLDGIPEQINLPETARGLERHYRIGPASRSFDDPTYVHAAQAFDGVGLRPLSPCHLKREGTQFSWIRRSRIDADRWDGLDVPLGEEREEYLVRLMHGESVLSETVVTEPVWDAGDVTGAERFEVAQVSASYGAGAAATLEL